MEIPSGAWRKDLYEKVAKLCHYRLQGHLSEDEIAKKVGFGSAEIMRQQLGRWGLPGWMVGGEPEVSQAEPKKARKARAGEGDAIELPPAEGAGPLFRDALHRLLADVDGLPERAEYLKDGRFVVERDTGEDFFTIEVTKRLWRRDFSAEQWRRWCEERGVDSEAEFVDAPMRDLRAPRSASVVPPDRLGRLIPVYILAGGDPDELLDALQPDRPGASREQLAEIERRLKVEARRYATGARGGDVKTGPKPGELTVEEHVAAIYVKERREQGATDERILEELRGQPLLPLRVTADEVRRLGDLRLD